jgi:hypothetical protein
MSFNNCFSSPVTHWHFLYSLGSEGRPQVSDPHRTTTLPLFRKYLQYGPDGHFIECSKFFQFSNK